MQVSDKNYLTHSSKKMKLFACIALLLLSLFSMVILLSACGGPGDDPKTVVNHYYAALQKKDYTTAIQYLQVTGAPNPSMNVTTAGELQTMDTRYGGIKSYKIDNQSINGDTAAVSVTINSYTTMDVQLSQINGAWIITGGGAPNYLY
jgi:hypothetical protein